MLDDLKQNLKRGNNANLDIEECPWIRMATAFNFLAELASYLIVTPSRLLAIGTFFMKTI